jgi:hypothetical protein
LFGKLAVGGTAEIHFRIDEAVTAAAALAGGVVFEKFDRMVALWTFDLKNGPRLPILGILSRAFHGVSFSALWLTSSDSVWEKSYTDLKRDALTQVK